MREICRENLYVLNLSMLKTSMAVFWSVLPAGVEMRGCRHILDHQKGPLSLRVLDNMDTCADALLHESNTCFSDSKEAVINFLNCDTLSEASKAEYIQRMDTVLENIDTVVSRTEDQLLALRIYLSDCNFEIVCTENKKPKFSNGPEVQAILNSFKAYHWVSSWKVKGDKIIACPTRK